MVKCVIGLNMSLLLVSVLYGMIFMSVVKLRIEKLILFSLFCVLLMGVR